MSAFKQPFFVVLVAVGLSLVPGVIFADLTQDCMKSCSDQKASDDMNCQGPAQSVDQGHAECQKNNQDIYNGCIQNCSPSEPPAASPPLTTNHPGATPQASTPQNTTPQGTTSQGSTLQRMAPHQGSPQP
jgi:hypothetical protein